MVCIAAALLLLYPATIVKYGVIILCAVWGMVAMAIFSAIFNMGIGCGTWFGGMVCTYTSIGNIGYAGGIVALIALGYCLMRLIGHMKVKESVN